MADPLHTPHITISITSLLLRFTGGSYISIGHKAEHVPSPLPRRHIRIHGPIRSSRTRQKHDLTSICPISASAAHVTPAAVDLCTFPAQEERKNCNCLPFKESTISYFAVGLNGGVKYGNRKVRDKTLLVAYKASSMLTKLKHVTLWLARLGHYRVVITELSLLMVLSCNELLIG